MKKFFLIFTMLGSFALTDAHSSANVAVIGDNSFCDFSIAPAPSGQNIELSSGTYPTPVMPGPYNISIVRNNTPCLEIQGKPLEDNQTYTLHCDNFECSVTNP